MKYGSLRHSIVLPDSSGDYSPDGLSETDIDFLLDQAGVDIDEPLLHQTAPVTWLRTDGPRSSTTASGDEAA